MYACGILRDEQERGDPTHGFQRADLAAREAGRLSSARSRNRALGVDCWSAFSRARGRDGARRRRARR